MRYSITITSSLLIFSVLPVTAQSGDAQKEPDSVLWLEAQGDSTDTREYALDLSLAVGAKDTLNLRVASSSIPDGTETINANQYVAGWKTRRLAPFIIDLSYEYWGNSNELEIQTGHAGVFWEGALWSLGVNLDYRTITFTSRPIGMLQLHVDTDDLAYGPEFRYFNNPWDWRLYAMQYRYSKDPTRFNTARAARLLGGRINSLTNSINDWLAGTELNYQFSAVRTGVRYQHAVSAVNQLTTDVYSVVVNFDLPHNLSLELEAGTSTPENSSDINFAVVALGFNF